MWELEQEMSTPYFRSNKGQLEAPKGVSYLELKYHLMLNYCSNISFYLLLKAEGCSVKDHPVIDSLLRLRTLIDKIKPLDKKLKFQLDKLIKVSEDNLLDVQKSHSDSDSDTNKETLPSVTLSPIVETVKVKRKKKSKSAEKEKQREEKRALAKQILEDYSEEPKVVILKKGKKENLNLETKNELGSLADDFGDNVSLEAQNNNPFFSKKRTLTQILNEQEKLKKSKRNKLYKGDEDLPVHDPMVIKDAYTRKFSQYDDEEEEAYEDPRQETSRREEEELATLDPLSRSVRQIQKYQRDATAIPTHSKMLGEGEKRRATKMIKKNKGLTPLRKKEDKNPRLKNRMKYERALQKQKSSGLKTYTPPVKPYAGTPGIKTNLSRSTKL